MIILNFYGPNEYYLFYDVFDGKGQTERAFFQWFPF